MADPKDRSGEVDEAFNDLHQKIGDRHTSDSKVRVEALREAVLAQDAASVKAHLEEMKASHGWLWTELTTHPRVASLMNELALLGL